MVAITAGRLPEAAANVSLHPGWFEQSLPPFLDAHPGPVRRLHVDCDICSSTRTVLEAVAPRRLAACLLRREVAVRISGR